MYQFELFLLSVVEYIIHFFKIRDGEFLAHEVNSRNFFWSRFCSPSSAGRTEKPSVLSSSPKRGLYPETLQAVLWAATASHRSPTQGGSDPSITGVDHLSQPLWPRDRMNRLAWTRYVPQPLHSVVEPAQWDVFMLTEGKGDPKYVGV